MNLLEAMKAIKTGNIKPLIISNLPMLEEQISNFITNIETETGERQTILINSINTKKGKKIMVTVGKTKVMNNSLIIDMLTAEKKSLEAFALKLMNNEK